MILKFSLVPATTLISGVALSSCSAGEQPTAIYTLSAFENVGVQPDADGIIARDAKQSLPKTLRSCGISDFSQVSASDSWIAFRFQIAKSQEGILNCIRSQKPKGAELSLDRSPTHA